ncbi:FecCD family ABC transporter permease [Catenuloplanes japonicus]|uniref:FecCD family ABC transporter permease n=1 Tax=Catenuloplanes japonicus TaxID=33876 RepID=UPI000689D953|nr:iron chelate uptake ABC transporter family permease subunit [Catenuloplanes japonicus]
MSRALVSTVLAAAVVAAASLAVSVGEFPVPPADVLPAVLGIGGDPALEFIVRTVRLPRVLTGALVGAALGLAGALFQGLARNPLASPDIIGVTAGASAAAVAVTVLGGAGTTATAAGAGGGALFAAALVYVLAWRAGLSPYRMVLIGVGVGAVLTALTSFLLTRSEIWDAQRAMIWLVGSLNARGWEHLVPVAVTLAVLLPAALALAAPLRLLQLGDDTARGLGLRVETTRAILLLAGVALTAVAAAAAGPVAFVALLAPAVARRLTRADVALLPSTLTGALLLVLADLAARTVASPTELPAGVVTGIVGAPYLLWLLHRANRLR